MAMQSKQSRQSSQAPKRDKNRPPEYVARARKPDKFGRPSNFYQHLGVAWTISITDKETGEVQEGFAVKLEAVPPNFDGSFVLLPRKDRPTGPADAELEVKE